MKPYGVEHAGAACAWGCCFREEHWRKGRRRRATRRARQAARREVAALAGEHPDSCRQAGTPA